MNEYIDDDGYPTEEALDKLKNWDFDSGPNWREDILEFAREIWWNGDSAWHTEDAVDEIFKTPVRKYYVSTYGWSGNESIIRALMENWIFWSSCWEQSRRGGHYIFEVRFR